jgi:hypothetical protein
MPASELVAMLDLKIRPDCSDARRNRKHRRTAGPLLPEDEESKRYAQAIGRPEDWHLILYPFWLSLDNCKKHPWIRKLPCSPRLTQHQRVLLEQELDRWEVQYIYHYVRERLFLPAGESGGWGCADPLLPDEFNERYFTAMWQLLAEEHRQQARFQADHGCTVRQYARFQADHGCTVRQYAMRMLAKLRPWLRIVLPEQFMPLPPCSPELHMDVEHMVGTIKRYIDRHAAALAAESLRLARAWQGLCQTAVNEKGNGDAGVKLIQGSARKKPHTIDILAVETDEVVDFEYAFGGARLKRYSVTGTAGRTLPAGVCAKMK